MSTPMTPDHKRAAQNLADYRAELATYAGDERGRQDLIEGIEMYKRRVIEAQIKAAKLAYGYNY